MSLAFSLIVTGKALGIADPSSEDYILSYLPCHFLIHCRFPTYHIFRPSLFSVQFSPTAPRSAISAVGAQQRRRLSNDPRTCEECGRTFKYPSDLKKHLQIHTGMLTFSFFPITI